MGSRKRSRPNPKVEAPREALQDVVAGQSAQAAVPTNTEGHIEHASNNKDTASRVSNPPLPDGNLIKVCFRSESCHLFTNALQSHSSRAWYASGSWPRVQKASPSTQIARETILADKPKNAPNSVDFSRFEPRKTDATSASASSSLPRSTDPGEVKGFQEPILADTGAEVQEVTVQDAGADKRSDATNGCSNPSKGDPVEAQRPIAASGWREWFGLSNVEQKAHSELPQQNISGGNEASLGESTKQQRPQASSADPSISEEAASSKSKGDNAVMAPVPSSSWFNVWPGSASNKKMAEITPGENRPADTFMLGVPAVETPIRFESKRPLPGSTWAFWSKDSQRPAEKGDEAEEPGELAVTGEASQDNPAHVHVTILEESKDNIGKKTNKRGRQLPDDVQESAPKALHSDLSNKKQ